MQWDIWWWWWVLKRTAQRVCVIIDNIKLVYYCAEETDAVANLPVLVRPPRWSEKDKFMFCNRPMRGMVSSGYEYELLLEALWVKFMILKNLHASQITKKKSWRYELVHLSSCIIGFKENKKIKPLKSHFLTQVDSRSATRLCEFCFWGLFGWRTCFLSIRTNQSHTTLVYLTFGSPTHSRMGLASLPAFGVIGEGVRGLIGRVGSFFHQYLGSHT